MSPRPRLLHAPQNGHDDHDPLTIIDLPERVEAIADEVGALRAEVKTGFASINTSLESLRQNDAKHDQSIGQLAKKYGSIAAVLFAGGTAGSFLFEVAKRLLGH
jgi:PP-loop superfamily ATP-utilizing enzyme